MRVDARRAGEQIGKALPAELERDRQARRATTANSGRRPSPTAGRCPVRRDAERLRGGELFPVTARKCALTPAPVPKRAASHAFALAAFASVSRVVNDFDVDDEERRRGIERLERALTVLRIDIGDERDVDAVTWRPEPAARAGRRRERRADEQRPEVRAADAQVDDRADGTARRADAQTAADLRGERLHPRLRRANVGDDVAAVDDERRVARLPQRRVQRGAALDWLTFSPAKSAAIHPGKPTAAACATSSGSVIVTEALLRQVDEPVVPGKRQPREALGSAREQIGERAPAKARRQWPARSAAVRIGRRIHRHRKRTNEQYRARQRRGAHVAA